MVQSQSSEWPYSWASSPSTPENVVPLDLSQCLHPDCFASNAGNLSHCQHCGTELRLENRYRAIQTIGSGGFAKTYKAVDEHCLNAPCVIKQFLPQSLNQNASLKATDLFEQEAILLRDLGKHSQIPELKAFIKTNQQLFIVQDYVQGQTLLDHYIQEGPISEGQIRDILRSLLGVLDFIHERQVIHRDIKPSNIMRRPDGSLVLIDFGSSYQSYIALSQRQSPRIATVGYASPEQMRGEVCPASDLYSLGLTCLRLYTGCFPDPDEVDPLLNLSIPVVDRHPAMESMTSSLTRIFSNLLQPNLSNRYSSALDVLADLTTTPRQRKDLERPIQAKTRPQSINLVDNQIIGSNPEYERLEQLLSIENYAEADQETWQLMLNLAQRESTGSLDLSSLEIMSLEPLQQIDALWQHYSTGRFGFTSQFQSFQSICGSDIFNFEHWQTFVQQCGWCQGTHWSSYPELTFMLETKTPTGHLPAWCITPTARQGEASALDITGWWRLGFITLYQRWQNQLRQGY
jgi:serine/threonine protein kinase